MNNFKVGDWVKCNYNFIQPAPIIDNIYKVVNVDLDWIGIKSYNKGKSFWHYSAFVLANNEVFNNKLNGIINET